MSMRGVRLGPYVIERELGSGGMGTVYAAIVEGATGGTAGAAPAGARVALKLVHPHLLGSAGFHERFLREAQIGRTVVAEHVVRTLDCEAQGDHHFLVMEYVEGQNLRSLLDELERVPEDLCRHIGREVAKGLAAIHAVGVVHRDLKPENVLITAEQVVKVMDLGVARLADASLRLSESGAFVGSVEYAAPEQFKGGEIDGRTDLHALGVLLYELSTGRHPFRARGFHEAMQRVCETEPRRLGEVNPQLSAFFEEVVHTLLVKDPRGRFASATQVLGVLADGEGAAWWRVRARDLRARTRRPIRRIRIPRETALHGREHELERLRALFAKAETGDGQVVLIEGEAGIGKSRLVDELVARLVRDGHDLDLITGSYPPGGAATDTGAFTRAFHEYLGEEGCGPFLTATPGLVPAFDAFVRGEHPPAGTPALDKSALQTCFARVAQGIAAQRPVVVFVDDLHFATDAGRALFASLACAVEGHRVLLVGAYRQGVDPAWVASLSRLDNATRLPVARLGPDDLLRLLTDSLGSEHLAADLAERIARKSDGNPFFVFEILRDLRERRHLTTDADGAWTTAGRIDEIEIPSTILDLVTSRVAELDEPDRDLLDVAACCGFTFDPLLVAAALGLPQITVMRRLAQLEKAHRLVHSSGRHYEFDHHQVQEALYAAMPPLLREPYHLALGEAVAARERATERTPEELGGPLCVELCEHLLAARAGAQAARLLDVALAHLEERFRHADAVTMIESMLACEGVLGSAERAALLLRAASRLHVLGQRERERTTVDEAIRLASETRDPHLLLRARVALMSLHVVVGDRSAAESVARVAHAEARRDGDEALWTDALAYLSWVLRQTRQYEESLPLQREIVATTQRLGNRAFERAARFDLAHTLDRLRRPEEAIAEYRAARRIALDMGDERTAALALAGVGAVEIARHRFSEGAVILDDVAGQMQRQGDGSVPPAVHQNLALARRWLGEYDAARDAYARALAAARVSGHRESETQALGLLASMGRHTGGYEEGHALSARQAALAREVGAISWEIDAERRMAEYQLWLGHWDTARRHAERQRELARRQTARLSELWATWLLGDIAHAAGQIDVARELYDQAIDAAVAAEDRSAQAYALVRRASLRCAVDGDSPSVLDDAAQAFELSDSPTARDTRALAAAQAAAQPGVEQATWITRAEAALAEISPGMAVVTRMEAHMCLWRGTAERCHLDAAWRLLESTVHQATPAARSRIPTSIPLHREVQRAWSTTAASDADPDPTESQTRVG